MKNFTWSKNDEGWWKDNFDTVMLCIEDAKNHGCKPGDKITVGECVPYKASIDAEDVIEKLEQYACNELGEIADDWLSYVDKESIKILSERLTKVFDEWLIETGNAPTFYKVENVRDVRI